MSTAQTQKVAELIKGERFAFLTTTSPDGTLTSRPMTLQEVEFDGDLWFFAERDSNPVRHVTASPQVNVGIGSGGGWGSPPRLAPGQRRHRLGRELGLAHRPRPGGRGPGEEAGPVEQRRRGMVSPGTRRRRRRPAQGGGGLG